MIEYQR